MADRRPNILLVLTDQQRHDTIAAAGNTYIKTPTMDRLCREGTRFDRAYTPSPVCVSARSSLITGQYPNNSGCYDNGYPMPTDRPSMMDLLSTAGYTCHGAGKMHFTPERDALRGFRSRDTQEELCDTVGGDDYLRFVHDHGFEHVHDVMGSRGEMYYIPQISQLPARLHPTTWVADRSIDFLKSRDGSEPFFLWSSFIHPHPPFSPPTPWNKLYRGPNMPRPKRCDFHEDLWTYFNRHQNRYKYRDQGLDNNLLRVMRAYYWACVSFIDYHAGRIVAQLEAMGELDNTLIVWSSDHGEFLGDYDCFGKRSFLDPAGRVPMLARLPARFPSGAVEETPCSLVDLIPTFLGVAKADPGEAELDGVDLAGLIGSVEDRTVYGQIQRTDHGVYMACDRSLKYFYSAPDQKEYLIDLKADPEETRNCAENPLYQNEVAEMRSRLIGYFKEQGYEEPIDGDNWRVFPKKTVPNSPDAGLLIQDAGWSRPHYHIPGYSA